MNAFEIALLVVLSAAFVIAVSVIVYNKVKGKSGCDCCGGGKGKDAASHCDGHCARCLGLSERGGAPRADKDGSDNAPRA